MSEKDRIQADAVSRAKEMYRRSQNYNVNSLPNGYNGSMRDEHRTPKSETAPKKPTEKQEQPSEHTEKTISPVTEESSGNIKSPSDPLEVFLKDKERALIVLLIALLYEERANTSLVLALMYLIM